MTLNTNFPYICQIEGCTNDAHELFYPIINEGDKAQTAYYCDFHAGRAGFCIGCGEFWGGVESFDFHSEPLLQGYCENCRDAMKSNICDEFYEDDDLYDWDEEWEG